MKQTAMWQGLDSLEAWWKEGVFPLGDIETRRASAHSLTPEPRNIYPIETQIY